MYDEIKEDDSVLEISKIFDINIKNEKQLKSVFVPKNNFLQNLFFLSLDKRIYKLNILTKKLEEFVFSKNHKVLLITGNNNNKCLIIIFKNCKIYAINLENNQIFYFKNLQNVPLNINEEGKENIFSPKLKIFVNNNLDKAILYTGKEIIIWYKHQMKFNIKKQLNELIGYHIYIQLDEEKKPFIKDNKNYVDSFLCVFNNDIFQGESINIYYFLIFNINNTNLFKLVIINYIFFFTKDNMFHCVDNNFTKEKYLINTEIKNKFLSKYSFTYLIDIKEKDNLIDNKNIQNIIVKENNNGEIVLIGLNFDNYLDNVLILFFPKSYKFFSSLISKIFSDKKFKMVIEDFAFVNNDYFIIIYFINGYFALLNTDFKIIKFYDSMNNFSLLDGSTNIYIFNTFLSMNLCKNNNNKEIVNHFNIFSNSCISDLSNENEKQNILINSKNSLKFDYFIVYTSTKIIGFHIKNKEMNYIERLQQTEIKNFKEIIYLIQFLQINEFDENKKGLLFDKIHNYLVLNYGQIFQSLRVIQNTLQTERDFEIGKNYLDTSLLDMDDTNLMYDVFIKFIYIFRYLNIIKYYPLSLTSYFIVLTNDFFQYLLYQKDVWLSFLLVELGEKYLLHKLKLRNYKNNSNDAKYIQGKTSFLIFNPNFLQQNLIKGYNRINNFALFSKLRLLIIFFCLMEFRNNQARNINVLYFVLAKLVVNKLKEEKALDDLNFMIKVIIRNWKYLKSENMKSNEEYILNSFSINYKAETLGMLLHTNNFISSNYIGRKTVSKSVGNINSYTTVRNKNSRFDFFNDFYSLDELNNFNNFIIKYSTGEDNILLREFSYFNHLGVVQKWIIYLVNYLFPELFNDYKQYINTHLKQTINQKKPENTSQDEKNLNKMIFFNLYIFMNILIQFIKDIFKFMINYSPNKRKKFFKIVLPSDLPYLISEFYAVVYNIFEKNNNSVNKKIILLKDINDIFNQLWERYKKGIEFDINNVFDFCHFLTQKGFKYYLNNEQIIQNIKEIIENNNNNNLNDNKIMNYMFSLLEFYIMLIHKNDILNEIDLQNENYFIFNTINILPDKFKKNIYELCFVVFIGHVRYYIYKQIGGGKNNNLIPQDEYNFFVCVNFIKTLFINYISENNPLIYENMSEVVQIFPDFMKLILLDESLDKICFNLEKNFCENIFDINDILNVNNFNIMNKSKNKNQFFKNQKISKVFYDIIFYDKKEKFKLFNIILSNIHNLIFNGCKNFEFELETDINKILNIMKNNVNENFFDEIIKGKIDEFKQIYKESNYTDKLIKKIKISIIKIFHILSVLFLKYKLLVLDLNKNQIEILQLYVLLLLLVKNNSDFSYKINDICKTLKYIINNITKEQSYKGIVDILININLGFIFKQLEPNNTFKELEKFIGEKHKNLMDLYSYTISNNITIFSKLKGKFKEEHNKFILFFSINNYIQLINEIFKITSSESIYIKNKNNEVFKEQREIYKILLEKYYNLTGFNVNMKIEFDEDWELFINNPIYNLIISDKFTGRKYFNKYFFEFILSDKIKNNKLELPNFSKSKNDLTNNSLNNNIAIEKEKEEDVKWFKLEFKNNQKNRMKTEFMKSLINKYNKFEILSILIKKIFLNNFRNQLFICFKSRNETLNLDKLDFIKYNTQNKTYESFIIKEKYIKDETNLDNIKKIRPYTFIKLNKFTPGNSSKSNFLAELLTSKDNSHLGSKIQDKLNEIQNKIKEYEDFNTDFNALIKTKFFIEKNSILNK